MAGMFQISKPAVAALDIEATVKPALRIDPGDTSQDNVLTGYIWAATGMAEKHMARSLISQKWRQYFDGFGVCRGLDHRHPGAIIHSVFFGHSRMHDLRLELMRSPCISVDAIKYLDPLGLEQTLDPAAYMANDELEPVRVEPAVGTFWPGCLHRENSVWVDYTAGYGDSPDDVPEDIRQGLLLLTAHWYENREPVQDIQFKELPFAVTALFDMNRVPYSS